MTEWAVTARLDAATAGLRYVEDGEKGLTRRRRGRGFSYHDAEGVKTLDQQQLDRIRALAVPPAWTDVWLCVTDDGHLQATGRDEAGRKQYVYHPRFTEVRDAAKFARLADFGERLPRLRRRVRRDLKSREQSRERVTAAAIRLLDHGLIRVGNPGSAKSNGSYGATTLRRKHVRLDGDEIELSFVGKSGEKHARTLLDEELAAVIRDCQEAPGYELFRYRLAGGGFETIDSRDVNDYLRDTCGDGVSAKDFRTWGGTVAGAASLYRLCACDGATSGATALKRTLTEAVRCAADALGNTPAVCRRSYLHPALSEAHLAGTFFEAYGEALAKARHRRPRDLRLHEGATLEFLRAA